MALTVRRRIKVQAGVERATPSTAGGRSSRKIADVHRLHRVGRREPEDLGIEIQFGPEHTPDRCGAPKAVLFTLEQQVRHRQALGIHGVEHGAGLGRRHGLVFGALEQDHRHRQPVGVANALTDKTRLLMICHMVNITGQILPVRKICDMAHSKGVEVMVDGAHAIAHIQFSIPDLHCDYYGASLHKWLAVPLGVGILYVQKEKISRVWPLLAEGERNEADISRLNHIGTHPVHTDLAITHAIDFYRKIGAERKEARLRFLQQYWTGKVRNIANVVVNTPADPKRSCGIANAGIKGMNPSLLAEALLKKYGIYTVAIDGANVHGCRITPNVFTTIAELDVLVKALKELAA